MSDDLIRELTQAAATAMTQTNEAQEQGLLIDNRTYYGNFTAFVRAMDLAGVKVRYTIRPVGDFCRVVDLVMNGLKMGDDHGKAEV